MNLTYVERARLAGAELFSHGIPSNFHPAPFVLEAPTFAGDEYQFETVEHWFQAYKVIFSSALSQYDYREIVAAPTARKAKELGRAVPLAMEELTAWDAYAPVVMLEGCLAKFRQNDECRSWLLATKFRPLVEHRPDPLWGDNIDGTGRNLLGKTLELVRAAVR